MAMLPPAFGAAWARSVDDAARGSDSKHGSDDEEAYLLHGGVP